MLDGVSIALGAILVGGVMGAFGNIPPAGDGARNGMYFRIGAGGAYASLDAQNRGFSSSMGTLSLDLRSIVNERIQSGFLIRGGYGNGSFSQIAESNSSQKSVFYDYGARLGINIANTTNPLYINAVWNEEVFGSANKNKGIAMKIQSAGLELDGRIKFKEKSHIEYLLGYSYAYDGIASMPSINDIDMSSGHIFKASLGYSQHISDKICYFAKLNGKYQKLKAFGNAESAYPQSSSYMVGVEIGLGF